MSDLETRLRAAMSAAVAGAEPPRAVLDLVRRRHRRRTARLAAACALALVVVAADSSKVGRRAFARICAIAEVDVLVTDTGISADDAARFTECGVQVITA